MAFRAAARHADLQAQATSHNRWWNFTVRGGNRCLATERIGRRIGRRSQMADTTIDPRTGPDRATLVSAAVLGVLWVIATGVTIDRLGLVPGVLVWGWGVPGVTLLGIALASWVRNLVQRHRRPFDEARTDRAPLAA